MAEDGQMVFMPNLTEGQRKQLAEEFGLKLNATKKELGGGLVFTETTFTGIPADGLDKFLLRAREISEETKNKLTG